MAIIVHPLTAMGGVPAYTADDYRHVVNPLMVPSNGMPFDGLSGVRAGFSQPLVLLDGLTVTVNPHCGVACPWGGSGVYTYAITIPESVKIADSSLSYKIAIVVDDPSQTQAESSGGRIEAFVSNIPDSQIPGLVIALVTQGTVSVVAPILHQRMLVEVPEEGALKGLSVMEGQEALVSANGHRYVMEGGSWHDTVEGYSFPWRNGKVSIMYGSDVCMVQVTGVTLDSGSWASADFNIKVKKACRPTVEVSAPLCVENGASSTGLLCVGMDGTISVKNMGGTGSDGKRRGSVSWLVSRRY